jgi:hypothetical protein
MNLTISPAAGLPGQPETTASVSGDVLTVDGTPYDLSAVPEGGEAIPAGDHPFIGAITRSGGEIAAHIRGVYGDDAERSQPTDPAHWVLIVSDGPVPMPFVKAPTSEEQPA